MRSCTRVYEGYEGACTAIETPLHPPCAITRCLYDATGTGTWIDVHTCARPVRRVVRYTSVSSRHFSLSYHRSTLQDDMEKQRNVRNRARTHIYIRTYATYKSRCMHTEVVWERVYKPDERVFLHLSVFLSPSSERTNERINWPGWLKAGLALDIS